MIFLIIIGMSLVTMIPRLIPALFVDKLKFPKWVEDWLEAIPYAALGALIFPGILYFQEGDIWIGLVGGIVAIAISYVTEKIILTVIGSILTVFILMII